MLTSSKVFLLFHQISLELMKSLIVFLNISVFQILLLTLFRLPPLFAAMLSRTTNRNPALSFISNVGVLSRQLTAQCLQRISKWVECHQQLLYQVSQGWHGKIWIWAFRILRRLLHHALCSVCVFNTCKQLYWSKSKPSQRKLLNGQQRQTALQIVKSQLIRLRTHREVLLHICTY